MKNNVKPSVFHSRKATALRSQKPTKNPLAAFAFSPPGVSFETQDDHEEVVLLLRRHWFSNVWWVSAVTIFFIAPTFLPEVLVFLGLDFWQNLAANWKEIIIAIWYLFLVGFAFEKFLNWYFNVYIVTNERVIDVDFRGVLFKNVSEASLSKVQDLTHRVAGFFAVIFDYGSLEIQTAADTSDLEFEMVPHPSKIHRIIGNLIQAEELD